MKPQKNRIYRPIDFRNAPSSRIALTCLAAFIVQYSSSASAADITWADSADNTTWTTSNTAGSAPASASWVGGIAPLNAFTGTTDNAIFNSVSNAQPALTVQTRIDGVDFRMAAGGLTMTGGGGSGNLFQVGAGGIDSSLQTSGTNTITNARIVTSAASTWNLFSATDTASTSTFTFHSTVNLTSNLTVIGQRNSAAGNVGIINFERAITGTGTGTLTINSSNTNNTVNLKGINTYAGVTNVNGGIVNVSGDQTGATGGWNIQTPNTAGVLATVNFAAGSEINVASANKIQIGSTANSGSHPASTLNVAVAVDNQGALQMERASNLNLNNGAVWDQAGNLTLTARGGASATLAVNAGAQMTYTGSNTVKLNSAGASGGSGLLNINGTGRFTTAVGFENTNTNAGSGVSRIRLTGGGTLRLSADVANLTTQTQFDLSTGGGVIDTNGFSTTLSGVTTAGSTSTTTGITGAGTLTKTGAGTLTLSGVNTYTGATSVSSGTLLVNGSISTSSLTTVASGATVGGSGTIGALTVSNGAFINPGNSTGILNTGNFTQLGLYTAEINGLTAGSQHDQINVGGTVDITGGSLSTMFTGSYSLNDIVFILTNNLSDAVTGTFTGLSQGATVTSYGGFDWRISYVADSGTNSFTGGNDIALMAIPEPSSAFLGALSIALVFLRRRRA